MESKTLWMGIIESYMDESYLRNFFGDDGYSAIRIMKDKQTGVPAGYAFVDFPSNQLAKQFLEKYNNRPMPGGKSYFRLNWAQYSSSRPTAGPEYSLFVGEIGSDVTEDMILRAFKLKFPSCTSMKIVSDPNSSNHAKGYGFIKFSNQGECDIAAVEMQGVYIGSRPIRISKATHANKNKTMDEPSLSNTQTQTQLQSHTQQHNTYNIPYSTNMGWNDYTYGTTNFGNMMDPQSFTQHQNTYSLFTVENQYPNTTDINFFVKAHDTQTDNRNFVTTRANTLSSELSSGSWVHVQNRGLK